MAEAKHPSRRALAAPAVGQFIHPDGSGYAMEVLRVHPPGPEDHPRLPRAACRRWGWKGGRVVDDGHGGQGSIVLRCRAPGVWTSPAWEGRSPGDHSCLLWRLVPGPSGQMGLFLEPA